MVKLEIVRKNAPMLFQKVPGSATWWIRCTDVNGHLREARVGGRKSAEERLRNVRIITEINRQVNRLAESNKLRRRKP